MSLEINIKLLEFYRNNFTNKYKKLYLKEGNWVPTN